MALDISDISLPDTSVAPELFSGMRPPSISQGEASAPPGAVGPRVLAPGLIRPCAPARARDRSGFTRARSSVCMSGEVSHRITGHIRVLAADLGTDSCEQPPPVSRGAETLPELSDLSVSC